MEAKTEIINMFKELSEKDRELLLQELSIQNTSLSSDHKEETSGSCPYCNSALIVKYGKRGELQKYRCKSCRHIFTPRSGTVSHKIQKRDKFEYYRKLMGKSYMSLKEIADKVGISHQTAFDWRHKILSSIDVGTDGQFKGVAEIDDIWFLYSQKGRKGLKYTRKRGGSHKQGDNDFQAKLLIAADRDKQLALSLIRVGRMTKADLERKVSDKFSEGCILVSDKHRSISAFAKSEGVEHISFKSSEHTAGGEYHVQTVNNIASRIKALVNQRFRGVSTKYLQSYANWYKACSKGNGITEVSRKLDIHRIHVNREGIYKRFIENYSRRTYRCPVQRSFVTAYKDDKMPYFNYI